MNVSTFDIIKSLVTICAAALIGAIATIYVGRKNAGAAIEAARIKAVTDASLKQADGVLLLKTTEVNDRTAWETRVLDQYDRLDKKISNLEQQLDEERTLRRKLETALHLSDIKISDLEKQVAILSDENGRQKEQIVRLNDENRQRQSNCEEQVRRLHDELIELRKERDALRVRLQVIETARHIGGVEIVEKETRQQLQTMEKKIDSTEQILDKTEEAAQNGEACEEGQI